jgi:hypothetical protein
VVVGVAGHCPKLKGDLVGSVVLLRLLVSM